ncbi:nucleic acid-binding protein [Halonotius terrestris]|uniref:Nucleic acid-binding protein n=1 Tax=Halonotius terrestris TaxID=2487750 RepID=A0A8J8PDH7_9EURY|nr:nucleic acid-binding protein [Halonotius terrestris]TQQ83325.1 nucleic acid-binding protein [Halonotius terrestris]
MSDGENATDDGEPDDQPPMEAARYPDGTILYPPHPLGPDGAEPVGTVDLSEYHATVVTWTSSTATPPGVREPNHLGIVEFDVDGEAVRAIGQLTTDEVEIGDTVEPVYVPELRDPDAGIREAESHSWDGYRFRPVE